MKIALALAAATAAAAALALPAAARQAADECRGLQVCIPVAGPWVAIPGSSPTRASWELKCPEGVVAGLDARLSDRLIDISFEGLLGSPVNPGITTSNSVVFSGTYTGRAGQATSYRPFIGCIPAAGGGRTPTAFRPGKPITIRVKTVGLKVGATVTVTQSCARGERLLSATHGVGLATTAEPTAAELGAVRTKRSVRNGRVVVTAARRGVPAGVKVELQVHATCAREVGP